MSDKGIQKQVYGEAFIAKKASKATDLALQKEIKSTTGKKSNHGRPPPVKYELVRPLSHPVLRAMSKWRTSLLKQFETIDVSPLAQIEIDRFFYLLRKIKEIEAGCYDINPPWFIERAWGSELRNIFASLREQVRHSSTKGQTRDVLWKQVGLLLVEEIQDPELLTRILSRLEQVHAGSRVEEKEKVLVKSMKAVGAPIDPVEDTGEVEAMEQDMLDQEEAAQAAAEVENASD